MHFLSPARAVITASLVCALAPAPAFCAPNSKAMREALVASYPLTKVGMTGMADFDYTRITQPGAILAVRVPGIYADIANTKNAIINTNLTNGQLTQATGFVAAFGGSTGRSRTLTPNEKVYITMITVRKDSVLMELLTTDVTTLGDGQGTRYRAELNIKLPGLGDHDARGREEDHRHRNHRPCYCLSRREQDHQARHEPGRGEEVAR